MATIRGGDGLAIALAKLAGKLARPATLRVGFLENARYPDGTPVGLIAFLQDYGAPNAGIPPRPFFRNMIAAKSPEWPDAIGKLLQEHDFDAVAALDKAGAAIAGQLRDSISTFEGVALKPATIRRKGFDKQLIETGHLLDSVDHEVVT